MDGIVAADRPAHDVGNLLVDVGRGELPLPQPARLLLQLWPLQLLLVQVQQSLKAINE